MHSHRQIVTAVILIGTGLGFSAGSVGAAVALRPSGTPGNCQTVGASRTAFPALGKWAVVNQQTFDVQSLPAKWYPFSGYYDGGAGQPHNSYREPSMLAFPGSWMQYRNQIYSDDDHSGSIDTDGDTDGGTDSQYYTVADAGVGEAYAETYNSGTHSYEAGYDVASQNWGFQWCARFNGGNGFDTAFAFVPVDGAWPPEIDFIEHLPPAGNTVTLHIHWRATRYNDGNYCDPNYPKSNSQNCHANFPNIKVSVGHWHAYAVTWTKSAIAVWIDGLRISSLTVTPKTCTKGADLAHGFKDTGVERLCLPNGYVGNNRLNGLEPYEWDMQVNSYNGLRTYGGDQTDLAWFQSLRP